MYCLLFELCLRRIQIACFYELVCYYFIFKLSVMKKEEFIRILNLPENVIRRMKFRAKDGTPLRVSWTMSPSTGRLNCINWAKEVGNDLVYAHYSVVEISS